MNTAGIPQAQRTTQDRGADAQMTSQQGARAKLLGLIEALLAYGVLQAMILALRSTSLVQWEFENLGWSYTGGLLFIVLPALVIWLGRRNWADYGVSLANWRTNLDVGIKAFLVSIIPFVLGVSGAAALNLDYRQLAGGAWIALTNIAAIALMIWILNRHKPVASGRPNVILIAVLLVLPIAMALWMRKLSLIIISTVIWQFVLSGFGEEFMFRGYLQGRLNQAFGRPWQAFGIRFGPGLLIASALFGLLHAFNGYSAATGLAGMYWGWALWTTLGGVLLGIIREKTRTILASGIAHGLPDAIGEPLVKLFGMPI